MRELAQALICFAFLAFAAAGIILGWHVAWPIAAFVIAVLVLGS